MKEKELSSDELDRRLHASVVRREEWKEKEFREAKEARDAETMLGFGATDMTVAQLKKVVDSDRRMYYRTLELNDKLYIQYKGWKTLGNLEGWTGLRALYAECNAFDTIQGLSMCRSLRSLFLQENCIRRISGLENCPELYNLNLSSNFIESIEGLSQLKNLNTLVIAKNKIGFNGVNDVVELLNCPSLSTVDIQDNRIWDPDVLPEVFSRMGDLRVLYLKGNPCSKAIPHYRKSTTVYCPDLRYLDDRPVFPDDRRAAEAFNRGGLEEERAERRLIRQEASDKHDRSMRAFGEMVENARREKRERDAMRAEDKFTDETDPVESKERRMKRQVDDWKEEHAEELKDDMKERAERCLKAEREQAAEAPEAAAVEQAAAAPCEPEDAEEAAAPEEERKLVYEDIWDDVPAAPRAGGAAPRRPGAGPAPAAAPAAAQGGVFLPWASGDGVVGMESVSVPAASPQAPGSHCDGQVARGGTPTKRQVQTFDISTPERALAGAPETAAWYSKFAEKVQAGDKAVDAGRGSAEGDGEAPSAAAAAEGAELDEMD